MKIDAHHHLWDLSKVSYPWLEAKDEVRFFGDPKPIQRNYELAEFREDAEVAGIGASVHIQVGAADPMAEAQWVQRVADLNPDWPIKQVVFCDLTMSNLASHLDRFLAMSSVVGVRQIVGRAPGEDSQTGTQTLLENPKFLEGLRVVADRGLSFDLQLLPELMMGAGRLFAQVPNLPIALCHAGSPHDRSNKGLQAYTEALKSLSSLPNVVCKISGLGMFDHEWTADSVRPFVEACIEQFGFKRLMFGSNFPVDSLSSSYADLFTRHRDLTRGMRDDLREDFFGKTAASFYGFDGLVK